MYCSLLNNSPIEGQLSCFQFLAMTNNFVYRFLYGWVYMDGFYMDGFLYICAIPSEKRLFGGKTYRECL